MENNSKGYSRLLYALVGVLVLAAGFNQYMISDMSGALTAKSLAQQPLAQQPVSVGAGASVDAIAAQIIPRGVPDAYGKELGVSFEDPVGSLDKLAVLDNQITLDGAPKDRYIETILKISCEYCCGAESVIFANGESACGCKHAYAMRGLAKWLYKNKPGLSDDWILEEVGKWKILFFPKPMISKAMVFSSKGMPLDVIGLTSNKYRGIEKQAAASSAGGDTSSLPSMVGGC